MLNSSTNTNIISLSIPPMMGITTDAVIKPTMKLMIQLEGLNPKAVNASSPRLSRKNRLTISKTTEMIKNLPNDVNFAILFDLVVRKKQEH